MTKGIEAENGDLVRITTDDNAYEGILMPRPGILEKGIVVIKLGSGYNIGIDSKKIKKTELVKKYSPVPARKQKLKSKPKLPNISILSFGGTISSKIDYRTGGVYADYTAEDFVGMCPELSEIANLKARKVMGIMSEDMVPDDWKIMAKAIADELGSGADGVVCTQGTDTLHFSAAAMSFMLGKIDRPVVFTASQRSIDRGSSDAFMNLVCAVTAAARWDGAEVVTCLHGSGSDDYCMLIRGTKTRKMHTSRRDAFRPIGEMPFAKVFPDSNIVVLNKKYRKRGKGKDKICASCCFEDKTALLYVHPGMDPKIIDFYIDDGYRGLVIAGTGLGHVPAGKTKSFIPYLKKAKDKGMYIVIASQTFYGRVHPYVYSPLRTLSLELECIFAEDMLPETAYVKLGFALAKEKDREKVRAMMLENLAGEISERSGTDSFLY